MDGMGERLRAARMECGMSQQEVADQLEMSKQTVSAWERGERPPQLDVALRLAAIYGVPLQVLVFGPHAQCIKVMGCNGPLDCAHRPRC